MNVQRENGEYFGMNEVELRKIAEKICREIKKRLSNAGIYFKIFERIKEKKSVTSKIKGKVAKDINYKMQDLIGIRIILYFADDVDIVSKHILKDFELVGKPSVDKKKKKSDIYTEIIMCLEFPKHGRGTFPKL